MIKRNIIAFMAVSLGLFGFGGCSSNSTNILADGNVISLKITYSGSSMVQYTGYSYHLREENGEILFDAHLYIVGEEVREITLGKVAAAQEDMETLRNICDEYGFAEKQKTAPDNNNVSFGRKIIDKIFGGQIKDGPVSDVILEVIWDNEASLVTKPDNTSDLLDFFKELAIRLDG
jgi:hypothetical protein